MSADPKKTSLIRRVVQSAVNARRSRLQQLRAIVLANIKDPADRKTCSQGLDNLQREHQELIKTVGEQCFNAGIEYARSKGTSTTAQTRP